MDRQHELLDETLLRTVARRLGSLTLVDSVSVFPQRKPESVVAAFDVANYPLFVSSATLEVRAYQNGDFHVTYREEHEGSEWMCRWDRHDNPHNSRDHFHRPPDANTSNAVDQQYPVDVMAVLGFALEEVDQRIGEVWEQFD